MKHRLPLTVAVIYLVLVLLATIPIFTSSDALSGIFAVFLTAPWLSLLDPLVPGEGIWRGLLLIAVGAAINAALLFLIVKLIVSRKWR